MRLLLFVFITFGLNLFGQTNNWITSERVGGNLLADIPFAQIKHHDNSTTFISALSSAEVSPFGRLLGFERPMEISFLENIFDLVELEDYIVYGFTDAFASKANVAVYRKSDNVFLFAQEFNFSINLDNSIPQLAVKNNELHLFGDGTMIRGLVSDTEFTEIESINNFYSINSVTEVGNELIACTKDGQVVRDLFTSFDTNIQYADYLTSVSAIGNKIYTCGIKDEKAFAAILADNSSPIEMTLDYDEAMDVIPDGVGGYYVAGRANEINGFLARVDSDGNEIWSNTSFDLPVWEISLNRGSVYGICLNVIDDNASMFKVTNQGETFLEANLDGNFPLSINNVMAGVQANGQLFKSGNAGFYNYPADSATSTFFAAALWIGGIANDNNLKFSAETYGDPRSDYQMGPLGSDPSFFNRIWYMDSYHINNVRSDMKDGQKDKDWLIDVLEWPAKGNTIYNNDDEELYIDFDLAPFVDVDGDGLYDPYEGDYPEIIGDEMLWWIFNDDVIHTETNSDPIGIEVVARFFGFDCQNQNDQTARTYLDYDIRNKGDFSFDEFKLGFWADLDLGCPQDDFIGSIPESNTAFIYNGDQIDGTGGSCSGTPIFNENIPIQTLTVVDRTLDNFIYLNGSGAGGPLPTSEIGQDYFNYSNSTWPDGIPLTIGGNGYEPGSNNITNFAFDGNPSSANDWSLCTTSGSLADPRIIMSSTENNFNPGSTLNFTIAFSTFSNIPHPCPDVDPIEDYINAAFGNLSSNELFYSLNLGPDTLNLLDFGGTITLDAGDEPISYLWSDGSESSTLDVQTAGVYSVTVSTALNCELIDDIVIEGLVNTQDQNILGRVQIFPNPTNDQLNVSSNDIIEDIQIFNISGILQMTQKEIGQTKTKINVSSLNTGMYFMKLNTLDGGMVTQKFIVE